MGIDRNVAINHSGTIRIVLAILAAVSWMVGPGLYCLRTYCSGILQSLINIVSDKQSNVPFMKSLLKAVSMIVLAFKDDLKNSTTWYTKAVQLPPCSA